MLRRLRRRNLRVLAIRAQRRAAIVGPRVLSFLIAWISLIWILPFTFKGPRAWRVAEACASSLPTPQVPGELVMLPHDDKRIRNGDYRNFDLVDALDRIADHPRRFLKTRHVTTARIFSENVTAPVSTDIAFAGKPNRTVDLFEWLFEDTEDICGITLQSTRDIIATLTQQEEQCRLADFAGEHLPGDATIEDVTDEDASAEDASAEDVGPQDPSCSAESANRRDRLLYSAQGLEAKMKRACDEIHYDLRFSMARLDPLGFRDKVKDKMSKMAAEFKFVQDVLMSLDKAEGSIHDEYWIRSPHLRGTGDIHVGGKRLEDLVARAATCYPGDIDPFTAVLLHVVRGTALLTPKNQFPLHHDWHWSWSPSKKDLQWPTRWIRVQLESQATTINITSDLLASAILPGVKEWSNLMTEVNSTEISSKNTRLFTDRWSHWFVPWPWGDAKKTARMVRSVVDGADRLEFLRGYLLQLRHTLPGMLTRLDRWDTEVFQLADDLAMVLSWGKKYTGRKRFGVHQSHESGVGGSSSDGGGELEITRWQIHPENLDLIREGLRRLEDALTESWELAESFNPKDSWRDNWFESEVHDWSSERATLRAEWEERQDLEERAKAWEELMRMPFWQFLRNAMRST